MIARHLLISGRVQGVFYRAWTRDNARELHLTGWVRNLPDGRVEAVLEGDPDQIGAMVKRMRDGPPAAAFWTLNSGPSF